MTITTHANKPTANIEFANFSNSGVDPSCVSEKSVLVNFDGWFAILGLLTDEQRKTLTTMGHAGQLVCHAVKLSDLNF